MTQNLTTRLRTDRRTADKKGFAIAGVRCFADTAENIFYVPPSARWKWLQGRAKLPTIGKDIDDAMDAIEKDNPTLKGVLPKGHCISHWALAVKFYFCGQNEAYE
jgi:hypothetical protein